MSTSSMLRSKMNENAMQKLPVTEEELREIHKTCSDACNSAPPRRRRRNSAISAQSVRLAGLGSPASENFPIGLLSGL